MTDDHLSLDELAELDEGLLAPERTSAIRAHLHGCADCRGRAEAIGSTRSVLADLPRPTMPDDVQARLRDALDAERGGTEALPETTDAEPPADHTETVVDLPARSAEVMPAPGSVSPRRIGRPTLAASAAAAAVVLAVGAIVIGAINHGHSDTSGGAALSQAGESAGNNVIASSQPAHFFQTSTGREYTLANLQPDIQGLIARSPAGDGGASTSLGASGGGTAPGSAGTSGGGSAPSNGTKSAAGTTTTKGKGQPTAKSSAPPANTTHPLAALNQQPVPKPLQQLANSRAAILNCAAVLTGSHNAVPLAVDFGRWSNPPLRRVPSAVFVFKNPNPADVSVYVTSPSCDDGTFYTFRVVPLPH